MPAPNLLFLFTDEQRYDTLACYGNDRIEMPNLNRLAASSTVFERAYVTQPVCTPSRSTLLTGLWPHTNGCTANNIPLPLETPCVPEMLTEGEYDTAYMGKWHLGDEIFAQHAFETWVSIDDHYRGYYRPGRSRDARSTYFHWLRSQGVVPDDGSEFGRLECCRLPENLSKPAYVAGEAVEYLRTRGDRPFCLFVNFFEPHMPFSSCRDGQYDPHETPLPGNFDAIPTEDQHLKARLAHHAYTRRGFEGVDLGAESGWRKLNARYWGLNSLVDTHAGRILDALEAFGLADNTIVVWTSDHGDMMGSHRMLAKCQQFEEAGRVPLLIRLPGQSGQRRVAAPVSQIDLVPTVLDLMGQPLPEHLQGGSLRACVESGAKPNRDVVIEWHGPNNGFGDRAGQVSVPAEMLEIADHGACVDAWNDPLRTIVTADGWKLTLSPSLGEHEFYNLNEDPQERTNLFGRAEYGSIVSDLRGRIADWQVCCGDNVDLPGL